MWQLLNIRMLLTAFAVALALSSVLLVLLGFQPKLGGFESVWNYASNLALLSATILFVTGKWLWRVLWEWNRMPRRFRRFLNAHVAPDIQGVWTGSLRSNWGLKNGVAEVDATKETRNGVDNLGAPINVTVTFEADWFGIKMLLDSRPTHAKGDIYSRSYSISYHLTRSPRPEEFRLYYLYRNETRQAEETDEREHHGAALLDIRWEGDDLVIEGHYWTDRRWLQGNNTAGKISLRRAA